MLTDDEARKLQRTLTDDELRALQGRVNRELNAAPGVVAKFAAGLLVIVALSLLGSRINLQHEIVDGSATAAEQSDVRNQRKSSMSTLETVSDADPKDVGSRSQAQVMSIIGTAAIDAPRMTEIDEISGPRASD